MKLNKLILIFFLYSNCLISIEALKDIKTSISGFARLNTFLDSRQTDSARDGDFLLYPLPVKKDKCAGDTGDINAHPRLGMLSIQSRLRFQSEASVLNCCKVSSAIEADFFGAFEGSHTVFRLRYAYIDVKCNENSVLLGQYDHPLLVEHCRVDTVSFNDGAPIESFSRQPQIRYTRKTDNFELVACASSQNMPFTSFGPLDEEREVHFIKGEKGVFSSRFIQNAVVPNLTLRTTAFFGHFSAGVCVDYKRLVPRIETDKICKTSSDVNSSILEAYFTYDDEVTRICTKTIYSQNGTDQLNLGGYGVSHINPVTDEQKYTNLSAFNVWFDAERKMGNFIPGIFIGNAKNLGASENLVFDKKMNRFITFTLPHAENIDNLFRISPRIYWKKNNFQLAGEIEITQASYGELAETGKVINTTAVTNVRTLFSAFYFF